jgi:23S rRNA pseudouridine1911/1915/1917 synthase
MAEVEVIVRRMEVEPECHGFRLDRYIQLKIPRLSRHKIQGIIPVQVTVDGAPADKVSRRVFTGSVIEIHRPAPQEPLVPRTFEIVSDDGHVLAIDKPAGLPMHPTARFFKNTLTALLRERYPGEPLQIAHRIDKETSGLLLVARGYEAARGLKMAFSRHAIEKTYLAIVRGSPPDDEGEVAAPMLLDRAARVRVKMKTVSAEAAGALPALTRYRVLERLPEHALVACLPRTGRQHQIRVHMQHLGCPIVGDKLYGHADGELLFMEACDRELAREEPGAALLLRLGHPRQALHAHTLTFAHPISGERTTLEAPLAPDLVDFLARHR